MKTVIEFITSKTYLIVIYITYSFSNFELITFRDKSVRAYMIKRAYKRCLIYLDLIKVINYGIFN